MDRMTYAVEGMSCTGCEDNVEDEVGDVPGVTGADADHEAGTLVVDAEDDVTDDRIADAVEDAGYEFAA